MIPETALPTLRATCRTLQIIVMALATGVCIFAIIAVVQTKGRLTWEFPPARIVDSVFLLIGIMALAGSFMVPALMPATRLASTDLEPAPADDRRGELALQAASAVQTRTIVGCALLEGGAFANLVTVLTHGYGPSLVLAAVLMSMIVLRFPTWSRYLDRIEAAMRRMEERGA